MVYVRSHTFCFCVPARIGVFILSTTFLLAAGTLAIVGWYGIAHKKQTHLTKNHEFSAALASISHTVLAIVSLFGLIGTIIRRRTYVSTYSSIMAWHLGFSIVTGAYFIYTLFHKVGENNLNNCISNHLGDKNKKEECKKAFEYFRAMMIGLYILHWIFQLWGCFIVADYVSQLDEEDVPDYPPPIQTSARLQPLATTYNSTNQYPFGAPENSFGQRNPTNV